MLVHKVIDTMFVLKVIFVLTCTVLVVCKKEVPKDFEPENYLEKFGYLDERKTGQSYDEASRKNAISEFQEMAGLRVTGQLNKATITKMFSPRCGLPDVIRPADRVPPSPEDKANHNQPQKFYAPGYKWDKKDLTYKFVGWSRKMPQSSQRRAIYNAFNYWNKVIPLNFREVRSGDADILIDWYRGDHRDGSPFDGSGGTLAHAFFPGTSPISGDTHFDEDETWTERTETGTNLEIVATHELGHALGLGHSSTRGALMQPFYSGYDPNFKLHFDDIRGVQSLYGARASPQPTRRPNRPTTRRPRPTTRRPRPPTRRPRPTTRRPRPTSRPQPPVEDACSVKFDDIANGPDGRLYAFRGRQVYKFNANGVGFERKFPKNVRKVFPRAPNSIGAAVYDRRLRKFYIFKGSRLWRYTNFALDRGYPKRLARGWYRGVTAALQEDNGEIRLLKGTKASVWREDFKVPPRGYPVDIKVFWKGLRTYLEAAVRYNRRSYFFKGGNVVNLLIATICVLLPVRTQIRRYFKWNDYYRKVDYRKPKAGPWLGCGRVEPK